MSNERWCIKNKKGQYLSHDDTWTTRLFAGTWEDRRSVHATLADWDAASFQHEPRIVKLRAAKAPEIPDSSPPRYITVRFKDSGSLLDATVLSFQADRGWVGGHVYKLVPKRKPARRKR